MIPSLRQVMARMPELEAYSARLADPDHTFTAAERQAAAECLAAPPKAPQGDLFNRTALRQLIPGGQPEPSGLADRGSRLGHWETT